MQMRVRGTYIFFEGITSISNCCLGLLDFDASDIEKLGVEIKCVDCPVGYYDSNKL
jgi:hypothetical protein